MYAISKLIDRSKCPTIKRPRGISTTVSHLMPRAHSPYRFIQNRALPYLLTAVVGTSHKRSDMTILQ